MTQALADRKVMPVREVTPATPAGRFRFDSIDLLRGLVMVVMALDHTRDYFTDVRNYGPENLYASSLPLFLTRWITHFCAPVFVFLAGTGAFIYGSRVKSTKDLAWFLLSRGLWLVVLELTFVRWGWWFNFDFLNSGGAVIWAIGWSMVVLSGLVFLPTWAIAYLGVVMICVHNCFDSLTPNDFGSLGWLWAILHSGGLVYYKELADPSLAPGVIGLGASPLGMGPFSEIAALIAGKPRTISFGAGYPLIPWIGVMAAGYGFGSLFLLERPVRRRWFLIIGLSMTLAFVVLRVSRGYGDQNHWPTPNAADEQAWQQQIEARNRPVPERQMSDAAFTFCSFLNCSKYPPSLLYLLMTLGPAIAALALFDRELGPVGRFFVVYGRVPLFYYLLHLPLIHGLLVLSDYVRYGFSPYLSQSCFVDPKDRPADYGYSLPVVYLIWIGVVLMLYPICRWYADFKRRHRSAWLSYL
jgi:uncharacterized membrane protein